GVPRRRAVLLGVHAQPDRGGVDHGGRAARILVRRPSPDVPALGGAPRFVRLSLLLAALRRFHPRARAYRGRGLLPDRCRGRAQPERRLSEDPPLTWMPLSARA